MDFRELLLIEHARAHTGEMGKVDLSVQDIVFGGVTDEQMQQRPQPGLNSLAWLLWHMTRGEDVGINVIIKEQSQVLDEGGWIKRLNVSRRDLGSGMTDQEVDEFNARINVSELFAYRLAVGRQTQEIIRSLRPEVLDEVIDGDLVQRARDEGVFGPNAEWVPERWVGKRKAFTLTWTVLGHSSLTLGEGFVVRGLLGLPTF